MHTNSTPPPDNGNRRADRLLAEAGKINAWIRRMLGKMHNGTGSKPPGSVQTAPGKQPPQDFADCFTTEMFVQLLLELPAHRHDIAESWLAGDLQQLRSCVHRLLGATVYCDAPELENALRELRRALHCGDPSRIALQHARTLEVIDTTLDCSGCR